MSNFRIHFITCFVFALLAVGAIGYQQAKIKSLTRFNTVLASRCANTTVLIHRYSELLSYTRNVEIQRNNLSIKVKALEAVYSGDIPVTRP